MNFCRIKYIALLLFFFTGNVYAQSSIDLDKILNRVYINLSSIPSLSYDLTITTKEAGNVTSTYSASVFENWDNNSYYSLYSLSNKQLLFTYNNKLGIERFWLGRVDDLPEIRAKEIDSKLLTTAISFSSLNINPLWLNIPFEAKNDQGFLVVYTYNKNIYSNFAKTEYYLNKDNIPVRILYYNSISNFPVVEILVTDYRKEGNGYLIYKMEYRDNSSKRVTIIEKSNVKINPEISPNFIEAKMLINSNINNYQNSFMLGIRDKKDVLVMQQSNNILQENTSDALNNDSSNYLCKNNDCSNNNDNKKNDTNNSNNGSLNTEEKIIPPIPLHNNAKNNISNENLLEALEDLNNKKSSSNKANSQNINKNTEQATKSASKRQDNNAKQNKKIVNKETKTKSQAKTNSKPLNNKILPNNKDKDLNSKTSKNKDNAQINSSIENKNNLQQNNKDVNQDKIPESAVTPQGNTITKKPQESKTQTESNKQSNLDNTEQELSTPQKDKAPMNETPQPAQNKPAQQNLTLDNLF